MDEYNRKWMKMLEEKRQKKSEVQPIESSGSPWLLDNLRFWESKRIELADQLAPLPDDEWMHQMLKLINEPGMNEFKAKILSELIYDRCIPGPLLELRLKHK